MTAGSLAGRTVAATRAAEGSDEFAAMLENAGARTLVWPTIGFEPTSTPDVLAAVLGELAGFDWIVFTSPRAVQAVTALLSRRPVGVRVAAVGMSTHQSLQDSGWHGDVVGQGGAESLIEAIAAMTTLEGASVLFPASCIAADTVERAVRSRGGRVRRVEAYRTVPLDPDPDRILTDLDRGVDVVTFASPSSVRSLSAALAGAWPDALRSSGIAAIGPTTAAALADEGIGPGRVEIAERVGLDGLLAAAARALPNNGPNGPDRITQSPEQTTWKDDAS